MQLTKHWAATLDDYAIDLAWSPDGTQLAAASAAGPVSLFVAADGARRHELPGHENGTNCLAWQPGTGTLLATGGQDGAVPSLLAVKQGTFYRASAALAPDDIAGAVVAVPRAVAAGQADPGVQVPVTLVGHGDTATIDDLLAQNG